MFYLPQIIYFFPRKLQNLLTKTELFFSWGEEQGGESGQRGENEQFFFLKSLNENDYEYIS